MTTLTQPGRALQDIVPFLNLKTEWQTLMVTGLAVDSRQVKAGNCFIAYPGDHSDGRRFLRAAEQAGAVCALVEAQGVADDHSQYSIPVIKVEGLRKQLGRIASEFYRAPSGALTLYAVTGTNGKTSVSQMIAQALTALEQPCGVIGTLGTGFPGALQSSANTTPGVVENNAILRDMLDKGAKAAVMEASSHGLVQGRMDGLQISTAIFTNLTRDHLDYHGTQEAYRDAKALLAKWSGLQNLILNGDDVQIRGMASLASPDARIWFYSEQKEADADVKASEVLFGQQGICIEINYSGHKATLKSALIGDFNVGNLLAATTALLSTGYSLNEAVQALSSVEPVPGRMQAVTGDAGLPLVLIDFAHTPDALEKALSAARRHCKGKLCCVFGCGGDRDAGKRPLMAAAVSRLADEMILTADNPRSEALSHILADMVKGIPAQKAYLLIEDRAEAVSHAVRNAGADDVILIAGKGHETWQEVQGVKYDYSDLASARAALMVGGVA